MVSDLGSYDIRGIPREYARRRIVLAFRHLEVFIHRLFGAIDGGAHIASPTDAPLGVLIPIARPRQSELCVYTRSRALLHGPCFG